MTISLDGCSEKYGSGVGLPAVPLNHSLLTERHNTAAHECRNRSNPRRGTFSARRPHPLALILQSIPPRRLGPDSFLVTGGHPTGNRKGATSIHYSPVDSLRAAHLETRAGRAGHFHRVPARVARSERRRSTDVRAEPSGVALP